MGLPRFELESLAPKAKRMDQATLQARFFLGNIIRYLKTFMKHYLLTCFNGFRFQKTFSFTNLNCNFISIFYYIYITYLDLY